MVHPPIIKPPTRVEAEPSPSWSIGDRVIFKPMYGAAPAIAACAPAVYEVRGVDGDAVWLRREGAPGHITAGAAWLAPAPKEDHT